MVYLIIGKSGAGKDSLAQAIALQYNLKILVPYTTRPMRAGEVHGLHYFFISKAEMNEMHARGEIIESRCYDTVDGEWCYFTRVFEPSCDIIYVVTPSAAPKIAGRLGPDNVVVINLVADDRVRLLRAIERESAQKSPNYAEICRRFLADEEDFRGPFDFGGAECFSIDSGGSIAHSLGQFGKILKKF